MAAALKLQRAEAVTRTSSILGGDLRNASRPSRWGGFLWRSFDELEALQEGITSVNLASERAARREVEFWRWRAALVREGGYPAPPAHACHAKLVPFGHAEFLQEYLRWKKTRQLDPKSRVLVASSTSRVQLLTRSGSDT